MPKLFRITTVPISLDLLLTDQMKFMKSHGYDVIMISANGKQLERLLEREACPHYIIPFTRTISPLKDLKCLIQLIKLIRKEKPDIIHTHTPKAGLLGMLAGKICGVKLKIHTIAGLPLMTAQGAKRKLLIFIEKLTYYCANYVLPNSNSIMSFVKEHKLTIKNKLDIIGGGSSNGIDLSRFSREVIDENQLNDIKASINYNEFNKYILAVGRVVKDKGIVELVEAFVKVKQDFPKLKLIIVGPLEKERAEELLPIKIQSLIENDEDIYHINWSNEVESYLYLADILVHASHREGFPNVPLQAGAMECPIICSEIPGNIDIVTNNQTGLYFKAGSTIDLIEKLCIALNNEEMMRKFSQKLRNEIRDNFSRLYIHTEILKFYQDKLK